MNNAPEMTYRRFFFNVLSKRSCEMWVNSFEYVYSASNKNDYYSRVFGASKVILCEIKWCQWLNGFKINYMWKLVLSWNGRLWIACNQCVLCSGKKSALNQVKSQIITQYIKFIIFFITELFILLFWNVSQ